MNRPNNRQVGLLSAIATLAAGALVARTLVRRARRIEYRGRTVLITGGSRGLGLAMAREAVARGANVAFCGRDEADLHTALTDLQRQGGNVLAVRCDVTDAAQVGTMVRAVLQRFGSIDVLINNAGTIAIGNLDDMMLDDFEKSMQTHFSAPLYTILAVLPHMRAKRAGRIVNIASIGGKIPAPHLIPYCAGKFALVGLSESLRADLVGHGIYVTTVSPGLIRTGSTINVDVRGQVEKEFAWFATGDVLPVISIGAKRLARRIFDAAAVGQPELITPLPARLATIAHALAPNVSAELMAWVHWMLPAASTDTAVGGTRRATGTASDSPLVPEFARRRNLRAAAEFNELG